MKNLIVFTLLLGFNFTSSAQNNTSNHEISLQESLNRALTKSENSTSPIHFEAHFNGVEQAVQLKWIKPDNQLVDAFIIEKSMDKINWQELTKINGMKHNDDLVEYFQTDYQPVSGMSYYRLKQVGANGKELFSSITPVKSVLPSSEKAHLFPEAGNNKVVNLSFENIDNTEQLLVVLRDVKGKEYYSKVIMNVQSEAMVAIPIEGNIPKGDYLVIASSQDQMYSQNVSIQ